MNKIIHPGRGPYGEIFCRVKITIAGEDSDHRMLSITGVEGPKSNGDARGPCGPNSILEYLKEGEFLVNSSWTGSMVLRLLDIWKLWHLNDMRAGSPAQTLLLRALRYDREIHGHDHYAWAKATLARAGLEPDPGFVFKGKPYSYGSAWLYEPLPQHVIDFLETLPETEVQPAWV